MTPSYQNCLSNLSCQAVVCRPSNRRFVAARHTVMFLNLVLVHEGLDISCGVSVLMFCFSGIQIAGRFTNVQASLVWRTQLALYLVVDTTVAAVATIYLASSTGVAPLLITTYSAHGVGSLEHPLDCYTPCLYNPKPDTCFCFIFCYCSQLCCKFTIGGRGYKDWGYTSTFI